MRRWDGLNSVRGFFKGESEMMLKGESVTTYWKGVEFKSSSEARFAFIAHQFGLWTYEPITLTRPCGAPYTPDFIFKSNDQEMIVEVKPVSPTEEEIQKAIDATLVTEMPLVVVWNLIKVQAYEGSGQGLPKGMLFKNGEHVETGRFLFTNNDRPMVYATGEKGGVHVDVYGMEFRNPSASKYRKTVEMARDMVFNRRAEMLAFLEQEARNEESDA